MHDLHSSSRRPAVIRELDQSERSRFNRHLHDAVRANDVDRAMYLLKDKVSVRYLPGSSTPLHLATKLGHAECTAYLLSFGFDANAPDPQGRTPLSLAMESGSEATWNLLQAHGATTLAAQVVEPVREDEMDALADCMTSMNNESAGKRMLVTTSEVDHLLNDIDGVHLH